MHITQYNIESSGSQTFKIVSHHHLNDIVSTAKYRNSVSPMIITGPP